MKVSVNAVPMAGLLTKIERHLRNLYMEMETIDDIKVVYFLRNQIHKSMPVMADTKKSQPRTDQNRFAVKTAQKTVDVFKKAIS